MQSPQDNSAPGPDLDQPTIKDELALILRSTSFIDSEPLRKFLEFVVNKTLEGESRSIKQFTVAAEVFGLGSDFDPQSDPIVRLQAGRLRRALDNYYANSGRRSEVRISIPKGSYIPKFEWHRDIAHREYMPSASPADGAPILGTPTIAVLPFQNLAGPAQAHLAVGLGEELATELTQLRNTNVVAYCSSHAAAENQNSVDTGRQLNADFIITGSVAVVGAHIRLNARLVRVESEEQIWARRFRFNENEAELVKFFDDVLSRIATEIGDEFGAVTHSMLGAFSRGFQDFKAYDAILRSINFQLTLNPDEFEDMHDALLRAIEIAPGYAPAWAHLAQSYMDAHVFGFAEIEDALDKGIRCAHKSITLDKSYYFSYHVKAFTDMIKGDAAAVAGCGEELLRINSNSAYTNSIAGFWFAIAGQYERGVKLINESVRLNPLQPSWLFFAHYLLNMQLGRYDETVKYAELFGLPDFFWGPMLRAAAYGLAGREAEAQHAYRELVTQKPDFSNTARQRVSYLVLSREIEGLMLDGLSLAGWKGDLSQSEVS